MNSQRHVARMAHLFSGYFACDIVVQKAELILTQTLNFRNIWCFTTIKYVDNQRTVKIEETDKVDQIPPIRADKFDLLTHSWAKLQKPRYDD